MVTNLSVPEHGPSGRTDQREGGFRPPWLTPDLFPFSSRWMQVGAHRIHYVDEGQGELVVLMLHGNPTWSFLYRKIIQGLRPHVRCIALDLPGFGLSTAVAGFDFRPESHAQVVAEFVARLRLTRWVPMMQDWGGPIGFEVASLFKNSVAGFVVCNTWAWPLNSDPHFERFSRLMGGAVGRFITVNGNAFVNVLIPLGTATRIPREVMNCYRRVFPTRASRRPTSVFPKELIASEDWLGSVYQVLMDLDEMPTLILWGEKDIAFRAKERQRFEQILINHTTVRLPTAGHFVQEDAAHETTAAIRRWLPTLE